MKKILLLLLIVLSRMAGFAQYKPADQGSSIQFTVQNFGFDVTGSFKGISGTINFDPQNLPNAHFDVNIDANTVNTDNSLRDGHLRGESYFDTKKYPAIRLESTKVTAGNQAGTYLITGKLTIRNITQNISFPFTATPVADGYQFKGTFKIKRKDFGVGGTSTIADELEIALNILAKKS